MGLVQKAFSDIITFSRASNATRVGPTGLVEYAPHNLLVRSQEFDNASWTKANITVTANSVAAPDGTVTADSFTESTDGGVTSHFIYQGATLAAGAVYTYSIYAKASATNRLLTLYATDSASSVFVNVSFNLNTGVVAFTGSGAGTITSVGNGWYRCTVTGTATAAGSGLIWLWSKNLSGVDYTGNGSLVAYIWGAQLSVGPYALDYTPTTSAAVYGPRFDYDPVTLAARGLLVEESRTNLVTYSEQFDNAAWTKYGSTTVTANSVASPDGTISADLLTSAGTGGTPNVIRQFVTVTSGVPYTMSVYAKRASTNFIFLQSLMTGSGSQSFFNLLTGTVASQGAGHTASIQNVGNGWYRCIVTYTTSTTGEIFDMWANDNAGNAGSCYIWGAQLE